MVRSILSNVLPHSITTTFSHMDKRLTIAQSSVLFFCMLLVTFTTKAQKIHNSITIGKEHVPLIWNPYYVIEWNWRYFYDNKYKKPIDLSKTINRLKAKYPKVEFYVFEPDSPQAFMIIGKDQKMLSYSTLKQLVQEMEIKGLSQTVQFYHDHAPLSYFATSISILLDPYHIREAKNCLHEFDLNPHREQGQLIDYQVSKTIIDSNYPLFIDQLLDCQYVELIEPMYYSKVELDAARNGLIED